MASLEMSHIDLECGDSRRRSAAATDGGDIVSSEDGSVCFSDADDASSYSQFYSTRDDYSFSCLSDPEIGAASSSRRASSAADSDCSVDANPENGVGEINVHLEKSERICRICHLTVESANPESGIAIELGCYCKDDLAAAHKHCAETWFKIKGNKTCEICNAVAQNVFGPNDIESSQQTTETNVATANAVSAPLASAAETRSCLNGHRVLNVLLACMVFSFVISWLFHFNIPS